jgi:hypothetical protein
MSMLYRKMRNRPRDSRKLLQVLLGTLLTPWVVLWMMRRRIGKTVPETGEVLI